MKHYVGVVKNMGLFKFKRGYPNRGAVFVSKEHDQQRQQKVFFSKQKSKKAREEFKECPEVVILLSAYSILQARKYM